MKKVMLSIKRLVVLVLLLSGTAKVNGCSPSNEQCPEVAALPPVGPIMCNLRADRIKVSDTVDTCKLLVQGDTLILGNLRIEGNLCCGNELCIGTSSGGGSEGSEGSEVEEEEGSFFISSKQFRFDPADGTNDFDNAFVYNPILGCATLTRLLATGFVLPPDFNESSLNPIEIDVHFVGQMDSTGVPSSLLINSHLEVVPEGGIVTLLPPFLQSDYIVFSDNSYQTDLGLISIPAGSNLISGTLVQVGFCVDEQGGMLSLDQSPRLVGITVRYPKIL